MGYKGRDIEISEIDATTLLVAACDSCGGIGEKPRDEIKVSAELVGRLTTRVAVMELIAVGATPRMLTIAISAEPNPTGVGILTGVQAELVAAGLADLPRAISTEKNITTCQTGLGIGITGICQREHLKIGRSQAGDDVFCLGFPKVGNELSHADDPEIVKIIDLVKLVENRDVHDILPIGSSGILTEVSQLAEQVACRFAEDQHTVDVTKSAGPSSCVVFTGADVFHDMFPKSLPLTKIGRFVSL